MLRSECISAKRPKGGKPKIAYCWTVGQNKICKGYKENWEIDVLETFKYYLEDDNRRELRVKTNLLRIRRPSFQSLHRETKNNRRLRRILRRRLGRRGSPYVNTVERTLEGTS